MNEAARKWLIFRILLAVTFAQTNFAFQTRKQELSEKKFLNVVRNNEKKNLSTPISCFCYDQETF